jgi:hypothetical protein
MPYQDVNKASVSTIMIQKIEKIDQKFKTRIKAKPPLIKGQ